MRIQKKRLDQIIIILSLLFLFVFYFFLLRQGPPYITFFILFVFFLIWPNESSLLLLPGLLPTLNMDFGIGFTALRVVVVAGILGQFIRGQWAFIEIKKINNYLMFGWGMIIISLILSSVYNGSQLIPGIFVWMTRFGMMLLYILSWRNTKKPNFGYFGWIVAGIILVYSSVVVYQETGSILAVRIFPILNVQGTTIFNVAKLNLFVAGIVVVSFWSIWSLNAIKKLSTITGLIISVMFILPLFMSGRRQAILAMTLSIIAFLFGSRDRGKWKQVVIILLLVFYVFQLGFVDEFDEGRPSIEAEFSGEGTGRMDIYLAGFEGFLQKPLLGWGLDSYNDVMARFGVVGLSGGGKSSHNTLIGLSVEAGIFGGIGLIILMTAVLQQALILIKKPCSAYTARLGIYTFPIIGFVIAGFLVSNVVEAQFYLISMAMICGVADRFEQPRKKSIKNN
jgi:hypothetical protein